MAAWDKDRPVDERAAYEESIAELLRRVGAYEVRPLDWLKRLLRRRS